MLRRLALLAALGLVLGACAGAPPRPAASPGARRVAVLPVDNATGASAPVGPLAARLTAALRARGVDVVAGEPVERWLAAHRVRFTGAVPAEAAAAAAEEMGVDAVLVTALEQYVAGGNPRIALGARLVSAGAQPRILWTDAVVLAGDDAPGLFGTGLVRSAAVLEARALGKLADSVGRWLATGAPPSRPRPEPRFAPRVVYRAAALDGELRTVVVLPFVNETTRRRAGDVVADAFVRALGASGRFEVVEPGLVRDALYARRIVMEGGVSLDAARAVLDGLDADLVVAGYVRDLSDDPAGAVAPRAEFTALMIDRRSEEIVWEVSSHHQGDDGVWAFDLGRVRTVVGLAGRMVASAADVAARGPSTASRVAEERRRLPPRSFAGAPRDRREEAR